MRPRKPGRRDTWAADRALARALEEIERGREELLDLLARLVSFRTESPPARNAAAAQDFVARELASLGFRVDRWDVFPGDPNVVGVRAGGDPRCCSLIINTHVDVAHVGDAAGWSLHKRLTVLDMEATLVT